MSEINSGKKDLAQEFIRLVNEEYENNSEFNEFFDEDDLLTVPSKQEGVDPYQYERSKVLFWMDREAYEDERLAWKNGAAQEQYQETISFLKSNGHILPFQELAKATQGRRVVPFVGAGLSKSLGMPQWEEALRKLVEICSPNDQAIMQMIDQKNYLGAAEALLGKDSVHTNNFIRTTYKISKKVVGPLNLLPKLSSGCIVTTNFDDSIEKVFEEEKITMDGYMHGTQEHNFFSRLVRGQRCLLKLHGDVDNPQTYIFSETQYRQAYETPLNFRLPLPKALRQIFVSNSLLFLGCSLDRDWTMELFNVVQSQGEYEIPDHYAILSIPTDTQEKKAKERDLLRLNIQPIWYPTEQHNFIEKLLKLLIDVSEKRIQLNG